MNHVAGIGVGKTMVVQVSCVAIATMVFAFTFFSGEVSAQDRDRDNSSQGSGQLGSFEMEGVSDWIKQKFTVTELQKYQPEDFRIEPHLCGCYDRPVPHYPYILVFFTTPKGDLVGRPDQRGLDTIITRLAVRHGERYCEVESEERCYGSFSNPCEFSDFRFGSQLAEYFPTCKAIEPDREQNRDSDLDEVHYRPNSAP